MPLRLSGAAHAQSLPVAPTPIEVPQPAPDVVPTTTPPAEIGDPSLPDQHSPVREPETPGDPCGGWRCVAAVQG